MIPVISFANNNKAKELLDKVSAQVKSCKTLKTNFIFTMNNKKEGINEKQKGKMLLMGEKYKLSMRDMDIYFDGSALWTHMKETEEVNITEPDEEEGNVFQSPNKIFTFYKEGFKYVFVKSKNVRGRRLSYIDLIPTDNEKPYSKISVIVNSKRKRFVSMTMLNKDGNIYKIKLSKYTENPKLPVNFYKFDTSKNKNVEVNDLR